MRVTRRRGRKTRGRKERRHTRRSGGAYIASGSYGCVFKPSFHCGDLGDSAANMFGSPSGDHITKYMAKTHAEDERAKGRAIRDAFDEYGADSDEYILTPDAVCSVPDSLSAAEKAELASCTVKIAEPYFLQMQDGGKDLERFYCPPEDTLSFMRSLLNLIEGLRILHSEHLAHLDIKPGNMVTQKTATGGYWTRFVDVGMVMDTRKYDRYPNKSVFRHPYVIWPFEARYLALPAVISAPRDDAVDDFYERVVEKLPRYDVPNRQYYDASGVYVLYENNLGAGIRDFYKRGSMGAYVDLVAHMTDIFSLGYAFAVIFRRVFGFALDSDQDTTDEGVRQFVETIKLPMLALVEGMMHPNPEERFRLDRVKDDYTRILDAISQIEFV
jgi:serine/threonine protein kinase